MAKELFILRSVPGAGKSTIAELIVGSAGIVCTADEYFIDENGTYNFNANKLGEAHQYCLEKCRAYMELDFSLSKIVIANTNTAPSEYKKYEDLAKIHGFRVHHLIVENRHDGENTHNVPEESLKKMESRLRQNIKLR